MQTFCYKMPAFLISYKKRNYLETTYMKNHPLSITEHHPPCTAPLDQTIRQAVNAWLTKELHK